MKVDLRKEDKLIFGLTLIRISKFNHLIKKLASLCEY